MSEKVLMKGNEAVAESAIRAGCRHFFGYPITPQTEVAAYFAKRMPKIGGTYLQAESEIAAINMVLGAGGSGARAMTSSSSPGISLKTEGISYICGSDVPCVIMNIERGGPGLGGIQPSQSDYFQATKAPGHGDLHVIVLAPSGVQEMADITYNAFDLAEKYRMPCLILGDGILGQMMEPVELPEPKEISAEDKPWAACGHENKREHNIINSLYLDPAELEQKVRARYERYAEIEKNEVRFEEYKTDDADIIITAFGATSRVAKSAINTAREMGIKAGLVRPITLWPFPKEILAKLADRVKAFLSVEMNMGQMVDDVKLAVNGKKPVYFFGRTGGIVPTAEEIVAELEKINGGAAK
ncbi:MAG: 3-methyl-2-oxobutanoate dehydrogenase subunit VorB [Lachnospiraceae bacterium]|nr:3-methyl-2-oxobutanoate dehydrogenase subunit VorB [Lachnospiraceae bacterium]